MFLPFKAIKVGLSLWYGALGGFCVPVALYYLWTDSNYFLDRCKVLIGILFAVMILPLFALSFIHGKLDQLLR